MARTIYSAVLATENIPEQVRQALRDAQANYDELFTRLARLETIAVVPSVLTVGSPVSTHPALVAH